MATTIQSVKFSFHRFETVDYVLPAYRAFTDAFQFIVNGFLPINSQIFMGACNSLGNVVDAFSVSIPATILAYRMKIPNSIANLTSFFLFSIAVNDKEVIYNQQVTYKQFQQILFGDFGYIVEVNNTFINKPLEEIVISFYDSVDNRENTLQPFWGRGYVRGNGDYIYPFFKPGECFCYCILDQDGNILGQTGKLKVQSSDRFTSLIEYQNNEDAFEFIYRTDTKNIVRLPLYLSRPQWPEKRSVYIKSNGYHKLLSSFIEEQYELRTEFMAAKLHRYLKIALAHDNIIIDCVHMDETPVEVINSDSYNPKWDADQDLPTAQGNSTLVVAAFGYTNSNCEENDPDCSPPILNIGTITETSVQLLFQLPENTETILINYRRSGQFYWQSLQIVAASTYTLEDLYSGADYEIKDARNCGESFGNFGRVKTFTTLGAASCTVPNTLTLTGTYDFGVNLPLPEPANIELLMMRPDGSTLLTLVPTTGFTTNPFTFSFSDPDPIQFGLTRFKVRSVCAPGDVSGYSNEVLSNHQSGSIGTSETHDFSIFAGRSGVLLIKKNGTAVINSSGATSGSVALINGDLVEITVSSTSGSAGFLKVYAYGNDFAGGDAGTLFPLFDSTGNTSPIQTFSFTTNFARDYFITASI